MTCVTFIGLYMSNLTMFISLENWLRIAACQSCSKQSAYQLFPAVCQQSRNIKDKLRGR